MTAERAFGRQGLGYVMTIPDLGIRFEMDRVRSSEGDWHGHLIVSSTWHGSRPITSGRDIVHYSRVNLLSASGRTAVVRALVARHPSAPADALDWAGFLEDFYLRVVEAERLADDGDVLVGRIPEETGREWLIEPLVLSKQPTILYGLGGVGKSVIAQGLAVSVASGVGVLPGISCRLTGPVVYLDWETDAETVNRRVAAISRAAGISPAPEIVYRPGRGALADRADSLARLVAVSGAVLLIIDSATHAIGSAGYGDSADAAREMFGALAATETTCLVIDHLAKNGDGKSPYGSVLKVNKARATWQVEDLDAGRVVLRHRKHNNTAELGPLGLRIEWGDGITFWSVPVAATSSVPDRETAGQAADIWNALEAHPLRVTEIVKRTGISQSTVSMTLSRRKDLFVRAITGDWQRLE